MPYTTGKSSVTADFSQEDELSDAELFPSSIELDPLLLPIGVRCGQRIAPVFEQLSTKYPHAIFLIVNVDKCGDAAAGQNVSSMPTFIFYRNRTNTKLGFCQHLI
ncbi:hypothetical protein HCN44_005626 [Aphidius gifuensis]|uniref:Thioredoxin domain-containing protein n=1 Tax=Aphidius gifuensis TaxID=684658 RepID=A0A835CUU3_APHGI|nr:hypothetical protein HCN44_005626 [Aphidius gifuensis]